MGGSKTYNSQHKKENKPIHILGYESNSDLWNA